jgi:hypothetical protein
LDIAAAAPAGRSHGIGMIHHYDGIRSRRPEWSNHSRDSSEQPQCGATDLTIARVTQAGAMPIDTFAVMSELMNTWNRPEAMDFAPPSAVRRSFPPHEIDSERVGFGANH